MKSNAKALSGRGVLLLTGLATVALILTVLANWFSRSHVGWLIESVASPQSLVDSWQQELQVQNIAHPAVIHWLPDGCLCNVLTLNHASNVSDRSKANGFGVYQVNSDYQNLGQTLSVPSVHAAAGPMILITQSDGRLRYIGAYSDGVRCNTGTSMVENFIAQPESGVSVIVGLDVQTCRCD